MNTLPPEQRLRLYERVRYTIDRELVRLTPRRRDREEKVRTALRFNRRLGDPQRAYPSVQVAGTSGKGSVSSIIAHGLRAAGLRTGLHLSPYLQVLSEKTWIDGRYATPEALDRAMAALRPVAEAFQRDPDCPASVHGMASLALSYLAFAEADLQTAVIETGLGGRFDLVQGLERSLCVITDLALDHTRSLGPSLADIAWHKAGIMEPDVPCVAVAGTGWEVLEEEAHRLGLPLQPVRPEEVVAEERPLGGGRRARLRLETLGEVEVDLPSPAPFLLRNAAVAGAALDRLAGAGWPVGPEHVRAGCASRLPGRLEVVGEEPRVILDGAHNPHKLEALLEAVGRPRDLVVLLGATGSRPPAAFVRALAPLAPRLVTTELDLYGKAVVPALELAREARAAGLRAEPVPDPEEALRAALDLASPERTLLVTGSIYLVGRVRDAYYPWEEVLLQGTSWPELDGPRRGP